MPKSRYSANYKGSKYNIDINVDVYIWEEDNIHFVYAPALDLTGYDKSEKKAKESFTHVLNETIKYMHNKDSIFNELERLGWAVNRKKKRVSAPNIQELMEDNESFKDLLNKPDYRKERQGVQLSLA
jgi:hypothetical protein